LIGYVQALIADACGSGGGPDVDGNFWPLIWARIETQRFRVDGNRQA
jgi:hypothetical protein